MNRSSRTGSNHLLLVACVSLLAVTQGAVGRDPSEASFPHKLSIVTVPQDLYERGYHARHRQVQLQAASFAKVPGGVPYYNVEMSIEVTPEGIDVVAIKDHAILPMPRIPAVTERVQRFFRAPLTTLWMRDGEPLRVRVRFTDGDDTYRLRYVEGKGLRLEPVDVKLGQPTEDASIRQFVSLRLKGDGCVWRCNGSTTWAESEGRLLWSNSVLMEGQPESFTKIGETLFVRTNRGHAFYLKASSGELVYYADHRLPGEGLWEDLRPRWEDELDHAQRRRVMRREVQAWRDGGEKPAWSNDEEAKERWRRRVDFVPVYQAAAIVEEDRFAPQLIECLEFGGTLPERCTAVAVLEKLNGNPRAWLEQKKGRNILGLVDSDRVDADRGLRAEQARWRRVFEVD